MGIKWTESREMARQRDMAAGGAMTQQEKLDAAMSGEMPDRFLTSEQKRLKDIIRYFSEGCAYEK